MTETLLAVCPGDALPQDTKPLILLEVLQLLLLKVILSEIISILFISIRLSAI